MKPKVIELQGHKILLGGNAPMSIDPPPLAGYWNEMIPEVEPKTVLILGLGGGTVANLILKKYPRTKITGVELSKRVLGLAKREMNLRKLKIKIVNEDAFEYIKSVKETFDLIIVDIWDGELFNCTTLSPDFIDSCKKLLTENGKIYLNAPNLDFMAESLGFGEKTVIHTNLIYKQ